MEQLENEQLLIMIVSHKHRFIFIKTRKTAGTSVEISLSKICGDNDIITPISENDEKVRQQLGFRTAQNYLLPPSNWSLNQWMKYFRKGEKPMRYRNHLPARMVAKLVGKPIWDTYFKFTIERNPFDKVVSFYYYLKGNKKYNNIKEFIFDGGVRQLLSYDIYAIDKLPALDKIYRYENLEHFETDLTKRLNLSEPFKLVDYKAKSGIRLVKDYKEILDEESIAMIKIAFAREMQLLGYEY